MSSFRGKCLRHWIGKVVIPVTFLGPIAFFAGMGTWVAGGHFVRGRAILDLGGFILLGTVCAGFSWLLLRAFLRPAEMRIVPYFRKFKGNALCGLAR